MPWAGCWRNTGSICGCWLALVWGMSYGCGSIRRTWSRTRCSKRSGISGHFQGASEGELAAWLRRILARNLADQIKHHQSQKATSIAISRCNRWSTRRTRRVAAATFSTPSAHAREREQAVILANALALLPPDHREVVTLRHVEGLSFQEVAAQMGRTPGAVRMLWMRALEGLGRLMSGDETA